MSKSAIDRVDARGLLCPLPVIRTQDAIKQLPDGAELEVLANDPGAMADIPAWCRVHGHRLLETEELEGLLTFRILVQR